MHNLGLWFFCELAPQESEVTRDYRIYKTQKHELKGCMNDPFVWRKIATQESIPRNFVFNPVVARGCNTWKHFILGGLFGCLKVCFFLWAIVYFSQGVRQHWLLSCKIIVGKHSIWAEMYGQEVQIRKVLLWQPINAYTVSHCFISKYQHESC